MTGEALARDPFEALGDPTRREILRLLSGGDKAVHEIAAQLPISRPAVSRHLRLLKEAGLVAEETDGTRHRYHLEQEGLVAVQEYLIGIWGSSAARFRLWAENTAPTGTAESSENSALSDRGDSEDLRTPADGVQLGAGSSNSGES